MIHLNLIDAAERSTEVNSSVSPVRLTDLAAQMRRSKKKAVTLLVVVVFVFGIFSCFLSVFGVPTALQGLLPEPYLDLIGAEDASRTALALGNSRMTSAGGALQAQAMAANEAAKHRESLTVKEIVGEVNPQVLFNNKRGDYNAFLPMEKISFQKASLNQFLTFLTTATPDDIGFSDCVFQAPNFFYLRGVSSKPTSQRTFLDRIKAVSSNFKTPPLPENAPATDITAFGAYNVTNVNLASVNSFVKVADVPNEIKALKTLAGTYKIVFNGLDKPVISNFGVYKRYAFNVSATVDFNELQSFAVALAGSPIRMGVSQMNLKFVRKNMQASLRFEMVVAQ